jgi:ABC-type multidrug transport system fused ATPase/permease subunit
MQNGCPYFWILLFSLFACTFVFLWGILKKILLSPFNAMDWYLDRLMDNWMMDLRDEEAYDIYYHGVSCAKIPITTKFRLRGKSDYDMLKLYIEDKYNLTEYDNYTEFNSKVDELSSKWNAYNEEKQIKRNEENAKRHVRLMELERQLAEHRRIREEREAKWDARLKPIKDFFKSIRKMFTINKDWRNVMKRTKQFVGALITILVLAFTFVIVNAVAYISMFLVDYCIKYWYVIAYVGLFTLGACIFALLYFLITGWVQTIVNNYKKDKKIWYVEPIIYLIWYPVKYVSISIAYVIAYLLLIPLKFLLYNFLWNIVLLNLGKFIWSILKGIGKLVVDSTGIFGEYFSASYTDYCPGIEWVDTDEN